MREWGKMRCTGQVHCGASRSGENREGAQQGGAPRSLGSWIQRRGKGTRGDKSRKDERATDSLLPSKLSYGYFLPPSIPTSVPTLQPHLPAPRDDRELAGTRPGSPLTLGEQAHNSRLPERTETAVCAPSLLEMGQQPPQAQLSP